MKKKYNIMGLPVVLFIVLSLVVLLGGFLKVLPGGMIGALAVMLVLGAILNIVGNNMIIVKDYFGGGPIVVIFGSAALVMFNLISSDIQENVKVFMSTGGFLDFYISALVVGSILGMNRKLLIKAAIRYLPTILGGVACSLVLVGIVGEIIGYGAKESILFIGIPIMGGGMGAGAVPLAKIFGAGMNKSVTEMMSIMVPAVALGNAFAIIAGGLVNKLGKIKPSLTGNGNLMISQKEVAVTKDSEEKTSVNYEKLGIGLLISISFFILGTVINKFVPSIHSYAWMIIIVAIVKCLDLMPEEYSKDCKEWFKFILDNFTIPLLIGIGVAYTDLSQVINSLNMEYIILVGVTIFGAVIGAGTVGRMVGFYPIEASITAGLCMANMGGTGDVAVLSASKRMKLMPFSQISSRLGGAIILIISSFILKII